LGREDGQVPTPEARLVVVVRVVVVVVQVEQPRQSQTGVWAVRALRLTSSAVPSPADVWFSVTTGE